MHRSAGRSPAYRRKWYRKPFEHWDIGIRSPCSSGPRSRRCCRRHSEKRCSPDRCTRRHSRADPQRKRSRRPGKRRRSYPRCTQHRWGRRYHKHHSGRPPLPGRRIRYRRACVRADKPSRTVRLGTRALRRTRSRTDRSWRRRHRGARTAQRQLRSDTGHHCTCRCTRRDRRTVPPCKRAHKRRSYRDRSASTGNRRRNLPARRRKTSHTYRLHSIHQPRKRYHTRRSWPGR